MQKLYHRPGSNFSEAFALYADMLFKISMTYLGSREDAEEIMQEVFYKLLTHSPAFADGEHEKAWLIRTAVNLCKDTQRSAWHRKVIKTEEMEAYYDDPAEIGIMEDIMRLPVKYKTVIYLYYYEDYSVKQIAEILKIGESAVKMRLRRGRELLKMELEGENL